MTIYPKTRLQSGLFFCNLNPDFCNLQSVCKLSSLIYIGFLEKSRLQTPDCKKSVQSGIHPYKSTTYVKIPDCTDTLSLRETEVNPAYAGLPLQERAMWMEQAGAV